MVKWFYKTHAGVAQIVPTGEDFTVTLDDETLRRYASPASAAEDLANGTCSWPSAGDPSNLGIPDKISQWQRVR